MDQLLLARLADAVVAQWNSAPADAGAPPGGDTVSAYRPLGGSTALERVAAPFDVTAATALDGQLFVSVAPERDQRRMIVHFDMSEAPDDLQIMTNSVFEALHAVARNRVDAVRAALELAPDIVLIRIADVR